MGYFSNGCDGDAYYSQYCEKCIHESEGRQCAEYELSELKCVCYTCHNLSHFSEAKVRAYVRSLNSAPPESELAYSRLLKLMENPKWLALHLLSRRCALSLQRPHLTPEQIEAIQRRLMRLMARKGELECQSAS